MIKRLVKHLLTTPLQVRRAFSPAVCDAIEKTIATSELRHRSEVRFAVEGALPVSQLLKGITPRQRAIALFAQLGIWDTAQNTGILVYVQFAERRLEIVADRGIAACVAQAEWNAISAEMSEAFHNGRFQDGAVAGLQRITTLLVTHFPTDSTNNPDELSNKVILL